MKTTALILGAVLGFGAFTSIARADSDFRRAFDTFAIEYEHSCNEFRPQEVWNPIHAELLALDDVAHRCDELYDGFDTGNARDRAEVKECLTRFSTHQNELDSLFAKAKIKDLEIIAHASIRENISLVPEELAQQKADTLFTIDLVTLNHRIKKAFDDLLASPSHD